MRKIVVVAAVVIAAAAIGSTIKDKPGTGTPAPAVAAAPAAAATSWPTFKDHAITATTQWTDQMGTLSDAANSGDFPGTRAAMVGVVNMANAEQRWLTSNPADACYAAVYGKWSLAITLFKQSAGFGIDGIDGMDADLIGQATSTMERATGVIGEAADLLSGVTCR